MEKTAVEDTGTGSEFTRPNSADPGIGYNYAEGIAIGQPGSFRVSVYRMQQQVDVKPSHEGVCRFHEILLAEAELLAGGQSRTSDEPAKLQEKVPGVKAMQATPTQGKGVNLGRRLGSGFLESGAETPGLSDCGTRDGWSESTRSLESSHFTRPLRAEEMSFSGEGSPFSTT